MKSKSDLYYRSNKAIIKKKLCSSLHSWPSKAELDTSQVRGRSWVFRWMGLRVTAPSTCGSCVLVQVKLVLFHLCPSGEIFPKAGKNDKKLLRMLCVLPTALSRHDSTAWKAINPEWRAQNTLQLSMRLWQTKLISVSSYALQTICLLLVPLSLSLMALKKTEKPAGLSCNWQGQQIENNDFYL